MGWFLDPWLESWVVILERSSFESLAYLCEDRYAERFRL